MSKKLLLSIVLTILMVPQVFGMDQGLWVDQEDLENETLKERTALKQREDKQRWAMERKAQNEELKAQQVKNVAEKTFVRGNPILDFSEEALSPNPEWIGTADEIFIEAINYMVNIGLQFSEIKKIKLHRNTHITDNTLKFIAQNFGALTSLDISNCNSFCLTIDGLREVARHCPLLTYINITESNLRLNQPKFGRFRTEYPRLHIIDNTPEEITECF